MEYKSYQHIEKLGKEEVEGILNGTCSIQPKIDGTNSVMWLGEDGIIHAGSRKRELTLDNDNGGFYNEVIKDEKIEKYLKDHPNHILYAEWLIPHTLKCYNDTAWRKYYVFDVFEVTSINNEITGCYLPYNVYKPLLEAYNISYIPEIISLTNPTIDQLSEILQKNYYLIENKSHVGEGIVIKNYDFKNKYGRTIWAKIIASEFLNAKKENHVKKDARKDEESGQSEKDLVEMYVSSALVNKEYNKILLENKDASKQEIIGRLFNNTYNAFLEDDLFDYIKKSKGKLTIHFDVLRRETINKVKEVLKNVLF